MFDISYFAEIVAGAAAAVASSLLTYTFADFRFRKSADRSISKDGSGYLDRALPQDLMQSSRVQQILGSTLVKEHLLINIDLRESGDLTVARIELSYVIRNTSRVAQTYAFVANDDNERIATENLLAVDGRKLVVNEGDDGPRIYNQVIKPGSFVSVSQSFSISRSMPFLYELAQASVVLGGIRAMLRSQIDGDLLLRMAGLSDNVQTTETAGPPRVIELVGNGVLLPGDSLLIGVGIRA